MKKRILDWAPHLMALFMVAVFAQAFPFKFLDLPETQVIFTQKLDGEFAASIGLAGLFGRTGLFSQYVIGAIEALACLLLLVGFLPRYRHLQAAGALAAVLVMSGAISFHVFTPLGTDPNGDGGGLFIAACIVWMFGLLLLTVFRRQEFGVFVSRVLTIFAPLEPGPASQPVAGAAGAKVHS